MGIKPKSVHGVTENILNCATQVSLSSHQEENARSVKQENRKEAKECEAGTHKDLRGARHQNEGIIIV